MVFPWLEWVSKKLNWKQFDELGLNLDDYRPTTVKLPFFLMHSGSDTLFDPKDHYVRLVKELDGSANFKHWLVPDAGHTNMYKNPEYENKLVSFLHQIEVKV